MVWIIILNWNGWQDTIECLESLKNVPQTRDGSLCIVVVDNGSTDDSLKQLKVYGLQPTATRFDLIESRENRGFAGGMNVGIKRALAGEAKWMLLLNNDTTVAPNFLTKLLDAAKADPTIGLLNPKILLKPTSVRGGSDPPKRFWFIGGRLNRLLTKGMHMAYGEEDKGQYDVPSVRDTDYATGGCLLVRRKVIDNIGLLPEEYFVYYEDVEWNLRARRAGFRCVVVPKAMIWHKGAASSKEFSPSYIRYHVRNGLLLSRRMGMPLQIFAAYSVSLLRALWQIPKLFGSPQQKQWGKAILLGIRDAWLGRTGSIK